VLTFLGVVVAMTYFHADSVPTGTNIVAGMMGLHGIVLPEVIANRLPGVAQALGHFGVVFGSGSITALLSMYAWCVVLLVIAWVPPNVLEMMRNYEPAITSTAPSALGGETGWLRRLSDVLVWRPSTGWALVTAVMTAGGILALNQVTEFLYWQF
jgi:hypothetical protein